MTGPAFAALAAAISRNIPSDRAADLLVAYRNEVRAEAAMEQRADLQDQIYLELVKFNATAAWSILQLAQMRQYLAEHLAQALTATTETTSEECPR